MSFAQEPEISLIIPCYKVAGYLPAFLASLSNQFDCGLEFEVIFVIDGCPEGSEEVIADWQKAANCRTQMIVTENRGVSAARNTGLKEARGKWVSFPDPDDEFADGYLANVGRILREREHVDLVMSRLVRCEDDRKKELSHPLSYRFRAGSREYILDDHPEDFQLAVHTAFFRRTKLFSAGVQFDTRLHVFEDGKFAAEYLLACEKPKVYICNEALYLYKVRPDGSGALKSSDAEFANRYIATIEYGHLALLAKAEPNPPLWLEYMILYDFYWLFQANMAMRHSFHGTQETLLRKLRPLVDQLLSKLSLRAILSFRVVNVAPEIRAVWIARHSGKIPERWVRRYRYDSAEALTEFRYFGTTADHSETIHVDGRHVTPKHEKWRSVLFFGETWLWERIVWVDSGEFTCFQTQDGGSEGFASNGVPATDDEFAELNRWEPLKPLEPAERVLPGPIARRYADVSMRFQRFLRKAAGRLGSALFGKAPFCAPYRDVWLLMDRDVQARDNAEAFYRYLLREQTDVNVRFVIRRGSHDYARLKREGFSLIPFGGLRHFMALVNCTHLISSHIDQYVVSPFVEYGLRKTWNYVFLQHGVTMNSIHRWLNTKDVQLLLTATEPESIAFYESGSPYILTDKEIYLSGFPRHDLLVKKMRGSDTPTRSLLIMPTWRSYLLVGDTTRGNARTASDAFAESAYVREWSAFLRSDDLKSLSDSHGLQIELLPHPNLEPHLEHFTVPPWVTVRSYQRDDISDLLVRAALTVTDYSSQAFEGAFCYAPCVYFQFDRADFYSGQHIGSPGYFDVYRDGFGPVVETVEEGVEAVEMFLHGNSPEVDEYRRRVERAYPHRDGKASERAFHRIAQLAPRNARQ